MITRRNVKPCINFHCLQVQAALRWVLDRQTDGQTHRETGSLTDGQTIADGGAAFDLLPQGGDSSGWGRGSRRWWWTWGGRGELLQKLTHQQLQSALALAHNLLTRWAQVSCQKLDSSSISSIPAQPQPPKTGWQKIHILSMLFHWRSSSSNSNSS